MTLPSRVGRAERGRAPWSAAGRRRGSVDGRSGRSWPRGDRARATPRPAMEHEHPCLSRPRRSPSAAAVRIEPVGEGASADRYSRSTSVIAARPVARRRGARTGRRRPVDERASAGRRRPSGASGPRRASRPGWRGADRRGSPERAGAMASAAGRASGVGAQTSASGSIGRDRRAGPSRRPRPGSQRNVLVGQALHAGRTGPRRWSPTAASSAAL